MKQLKTDDELPYEKFLLRGPCALTDAELLAIIIRTGTTKEKPLEIANNILNYNGSDKGILGICHMSILELQQVHGIGQVKAIKISCIAELSKRITMTCTKEKLNFNNPKTIADYYMEQMRHFEVEKVILVYLDNKSKRLDDCILSQGTINSSLLSPREIFLKAIRRQAVFIVLLHNHPSGDPTPSKQDIFMTRKLKELSEMMEIPLIDHIIIGDNKYVSFKEAGFIS
jgi:DNA repair protein RadC